MNRLALDNLEQAISNLKRGSRDTGAEDLLAKLEGLLGELRGYKPDDVDTPGRREAQAVAAEAPKTEDAPEDKPDEPSVAKSFEEAAEIAKERLTASA